MLKGLANIFELSGLQTNESLIGSSSTELKIYSMSSSVLKTYYYTSMTRDNVT